MHLSCLSLHYLALALAILIRSVRRLSAELISATRPGPGAGHRARHKNKI